MAFNFLQVVILIWLATLSTIVKDVVMVGNLLLQLVHLGGGIISWCSKK
jgi:hypothetical protein